MKRVALTIISIVLLGTISSFAQDSIQPIVVKKAFLGNKYFYGDTRILSISVMEGIVAHDELALKEIQRSSVISQVSNIVSYVGGFAIGWEVANLIWNKKKYNSYVLWGGVGTTAVGLGLSIWADSHLKKGVALYNGHLGTVSYNPIKVDLEIEPCGIGITMSF